MEIFSSSPQAPFTYHMELDNEEELVAVLSNILVVGANVKYSKSLNNLDQSEIEVMRQYLQSFGWDAEYAMQRVGKEVLDYYRDGKPYIRIIEVNSWNITFMVAQHARTNCSAAGLA